MKSWTSGDERGSITAETDNSGAVVETHQYGAFGEPQNQSESRFRYTEQILIPESELYHYKARVYHPELGSVMQTDPIGYEAGINWYTYVKNDPIQFVDPTGKIPEAARRSNLKSEKAHDKQYPNSMREVRIYRNGRLWRVQDRLRIVGDRLIFTEIKGALHERTSKKHKRRLNRAAEYSLWEKISDIHGSFQQMRDMYMLHQSDLSDYTIPRLDHKKLSEFKGVNIILEIYNIDKNSGNIFSIDSYDLSTPDGLRLSL